jgi:hypothetical protein
VIVIERREARQWDEKGDGDGSLSPDVTPDVPKHLYLYSTTRIMFYLHISYIRSNDRTVD